MILNIRNKIEVVTEKLKPFKGVIWFLVLFLLFDLLWKLSVHQGEDESILLVFGYDFTECIYGFCLWTARATHWFVYTIFGYTDFKIDDIVVFFENSLHVHVIWGCTGLKQLFMFSFIILLYYGPNKQKTWYIPMSLIILLLINILRLSIICVIVKDPFPDWFVGFNEWYNGRTWDDTTASYWLFYEDWFHLFHRDIFTWIYYDGVIFILWLVWEEKFSKKYRRHKLSSAATGDASEELVDIGNDN